MNVFTERVIRIIQEIPAGHVMTYGQVAAAAGSPRGARQVVRVLHSMSAKYKLPWHRIINAQGGISAPADAEGKGLHQRELLELEGVTFSIDGKIDLTEYRWFPLDTEEG
ncbi:MAG TPA: MGMT family protein [Sporosarcina psychrophila]|uniref:MGMT family protein n=1 Tax=Sporosarcina psychrophila TaxID=1476 RepID=A0A921KFH3_SPOPS|nr:MGMT family protein [Sporosarcina psychrophila]